MTYSVFSRRSSAFIGGHPLDSRWEDYEMRKGFTRKPQGDDAATRGNNYITRSGLQRLKDEHRFLLTRERPAVAERVVSIVGTDEVDLNRNHISWVSPLGRALMKSAAGDSVVLRAPAGTEYLTVLEVCYERISVEPFREPPGSEASTKGLPRRR